MPTPPLNPLAGYHPAPAGFHPNPRVLYVDDDEAMLFLVQRGLARYGCQVTTSPDAEQALAVLACQGAIFDLIVTDYNMPGMSGIEFVRAAHTIDPALQIALASGFVNETLLEKVRDLKLAGVIPKPSTVGELCAKIKAVLDGTAG